MQDMFLVRYDDNWYRTSSKLDLGSLAVANFDAVVKISNGRYEVLKDRGGIHQDETGDADLLIMKLFAVGKTLNDFPQFFPCKRQYVSTDFGIRENGDLHEYEVERGL